MKNSFDVIVIGAGHAGCEAAYAAARIGARVGLCTLSPDTVAHMPCNPAIGGTAKGHLVREIDALDGIMARATDRAGIQFRILARSTRPPFNSGCSTGAAGRRCSRRARRRTRKSTAAG